MGDHEREVNEAEWIDLENDLDDEVLDPEEEESTGEVVYPPDLDGEAIPIANVAALEAELQETRNRMLRHAADYDNYRKRLHRDQKDAVRFANEQILRDLLPVLDSLDRAAGMPLDEATVHGLHEGLALVMENFTVALARHGVRRMGSEVGTPFNPAFHEALQQVDTEEVEPGCIAQEIQAGYLFFDRLLRPARVIVAAVPPGFTSTEESEEEEISADEGYEEERDVEESDVEESDAFDEEDTLPEARLTPVEEPSSEEE